MKYIITGASGFLGSHLCKELQSEAESVTAIVRKTSDICVLDKLDVDIKYADISRSEEISELFNGHDIVIHTARCRRTGGIRQIFFVRITQGLKIS